MAENDTLPADMEDEPAGWAKRWQAEFEASRQFLKSWRERSAPACLKAYEDDRSEESTQQTVNLFWANVTVQSALMYSRVPRVEVTRAYADSQDAPARVAGPVILQRLLNADIDRPTDSYCRALKNVLRDYRIVGYGLARVRYEATFSETKQAERKDPATGRVLVQAGTKREKVHEDCAVDYIYWEDQLWSPCRTYDALRWWAFKSTMTKEEVTARFGEEVAEKIPYNAVQLDKASEDPGGANPWARAEVWEIWSKTDKSVYWYVEGYAEVLEKKPDPYGLTGFFPFPEPMMANLTTSKFRPRPDYAMSQDLYKEINEIQTRIRLLEQALRVAGVYDQSCGPLERLLTETAGNELIPVSGWAKFAEKGGLDGAIQFLPIREIVETIVQLRVQQKEAQQLLYEITGQSDLMRGQTIKAGASATESAAKVRYGSVRVQDIQDEFARFATGLQQIRAELIAKFYDEKTILKRANVAYVQEDPRVVMEAVKLLKTDFPSYRVLVRSETMAAQDFASLKQDRVELLTAAGSLMQGLAPLIQMVGPAGAVLGIGLMKWTLAGMRGSSEVEALFDKALQQAQQAAQQAAAAGPQAQQPDPKMMAQQMKNQGEVQKLQLQAQLDAQKMQQEAQLTERQQQLQMQYNVQETAAVERIKTREAQARSAYKVTGQKKE